MKKKEKFHKLSIILWINLLLIFCSGYAFPTDAPYLLVNCTVGNDVKMYFNKDTLNSFYIDVDNDYIVNMTSGTRYTYTSNYRITWPAYDDAYYYPNTSGYNSQTFRVTDIIEDHRYDNDEINFSEHAEIMLMAIGGGMLLCLFILLLK